MIRKHFRSTAAALAVLAGVFGLAACSSDAAKVNENITTAADQFEVQRKIVGINGITDTPAFEVEGRCSLTEQGRQALAKERRVWLEVSGAITGLLQEAT